MGSSQAELNLAENERKILNAGRIPYESFKVSESNPLALLPHLPSISMLGLALSKLFPFSRMQSSPCLA